MSTSDLTQIVANYDAIHLTAGIVSESEVTSSIVTPPVTNSVKPILNKLNKRNKSNSELICKRICKDLSYYYSLTNVKYYLDDEEEEAATTEAAATTSRVSNVNKCLSSSLSSISSAKSSERPLSTSPHRSVGDNKSSSSSDEEEDILNHQPVSLPLQSYQIPFYKLQKSITLPNAHEMAQFANTQTMGFSKTSSMNASSSLNSNNMSCEGVLGIDDVDVDEENHGAVYYCENGQINEEVSSPPPHQHLNDFKFPTEPSPIVGAAQQQYRTTTATTTTTTHKSLSEYCVTSSRYILNRFRKYKNYRHFRCSMKRCSKLSKSMSMNKRGLVFVFIFIFAY